MQPLNSPALSASITELSHPQGGGPRFCFAFSIFLYSVQDSYLFTSVRSGVQFNNKKQQQKKTTSTVVSVHACYTWAQRKLAAEPIGQGLVLD